ncbi:MAG: enoyl-CoA hydratase/isomerase family protein [Gemmatimonadota bacterium]
MTSYVRVERRGLVGWVTLDRPPRNAFDGTMRDELVERLVEALEDPATRVVVVTGEGRGFCAGADVRYLSELAEARDAAAFSRLVDSGREVVTRIRACPKPVLAAVNGAAAGGGANLALACDLRVASESASIGQSFIRIGLHPDYAGTFLLPRIVGTSRALELMWTGRLVPAPEALALGLFDRVVPDGELHAEVTRLAGELAAAPAEAVGRIKAAVYGGSTSKLEDALGKEHDAQLALFGGADVAEGLRAFFEKRPPAFGKARS